MAKQQIKSIGEKAKQSTEKRWITEIRALPWNSDNPDDIGIWRGPHVPGETAEEAQKWCWENGLGHCKVIGEKI
jgi:hypothetical protein